MLCIAAPLISLGHDVTVVDLEYLYRSGNFRLNEATWLDDSCELMLANRPDVVGLAVLADTLPTALLMGKRIKQLAPRTTVVLGGPGTFGTFPESQHWYAEHVDFVCQAEGELALSDLVTALAEGTDPYQVRGMWSLRAGQVNYTGAQPYVDLDHIPMPAYGSVPMTEYLKLASPRIFDMHLGSGCTYSCKFCMTSTFWHREFRSKSPDVVLTELDWLHDRYGITRVNFLHDNFANRRPYLENFIDYFTAHNTRYEWGCAVRPDNVNADLIHRMKKAGCFNIFCGTDAGSDKILQKMQKMPSSKRTYKFFDACRQAAMPFETNTIIGYPEEEAADLEAALEVILDAVAYGAVSSDLSILQPLPGADITNENKEYLRPMDAQLLGTFLPEEVRELVRDAPEGFPGFFFIRRDNRPYEYYADILRLTRYFTRRYYLFLRFLKQQCGLTYVSVFERLLGVGAERIAGALPGLLLELHGAQRTGAAALLEYESALDLLRPGDVHAELDNVYLDPAAVDAAATCLLLDLPADVLSIAEDPVRLSLTEAALSPTSYLLSYTGGNEVRTLRLQPWHRRLVMHLREHGQVNLQDVAEQLARAAGNSVDEVRPHSDPVIREIAHALARAAGREVAETERLITLA